MEKLLILSPVYFDVPSAKRLRREIETMYSSSFDISFFFIDDSAGADKDFHELSDQSNTFIFRPMFNLGHQRAIVFGLRCLMNRYSEREIIITLDSDGEDRPEDIKALISGLNDTKEFSLARRTKRHEPFMFKLLYLNFKTLFFILTGLTIKTGNFACYRASSIKKIIGHPLFNLVYSSVFMSLKLNLSLVPCERGTRYFGSSKMNTISLISHGIRMLMPFLDRISIRFLVFSFSLAGLSSFAFIAMMVSSWGFDYNVPSGVKLASFITIGVSLISMLNFISLFALHSQSMRDAYNFIDLVEKEKSPKMKQVA